MSDMEKKIANNIESNLRQIQIPIRPLFFTFLKLGLTSFGGPVAHFAYFRNEFVVRRNWLNDQIYSDLVALCQFLPGPASSQFGICIGLAKAGLPGAFAAWLGFTMPSALALMLFGLSVSTLGSITDQGWFHGLKIITVAVVVQAVWAMARTLCPDRQRIMIMVLATFAMLIWPSDVIQVAVICLGGIAGVVFLRTVSSNQINSLSLVLNRRFSLTVLMSFFLLLLCLPLLSKLIPSHTIAMIDSFYRAGSLVFGGGHVVLPLLQSEVVQSGWISNDIFLAGYGAAQAIPGPLFTFAAYLGVVMRPSPNGWLGGLICLLSIFLPSFLLVIGILPFWEVLLHHVNMARSVMSGINASVVGMLVAALYHPVWTSGIHSSADFGLALASFVLLQFWKVPPWIVVLLSAGCGAIFL